MMSDSSASSTKFNTATPVKQTFAVILYVWRVNMSRTELPISFTPGKAQHRQSRFIYLRQPLSDISLGQKAIVCHLVEAESEYSLK